MSTCDRRGFGLHRSSAHRTGRMPLCSFCAIHSRKGRLYRAYLSLPPWLEHALPGSFSAAETYERVGKEQERAWSTEERAMTNNGRHQAVTSQKKILPCSRQQARRKHPWCRRVINAALAWVAEPILFARWGGAKGDSRGYFTCRI